jgi:hypothetical protein
LSFSIKTADDKTTHLPGGYHPIKYKDKPWGSELKDWALATMQGPGGFDRTASQMLDTGFLESRQTVVKGKLRFDRGVEVNHLMNMAHVLAWRETIRDLDGLLQHDKVREAVQEHHGPATLASLNGWLKDLAAGSAGAREGLEGSLAYLRQGYVAARLGFRAKTALLQISGLRIAAVRIGPKWVWRGVTTWFSSPSNIANMPRWVLSESRFMRSRFEGSYMRELNELRQDVPSRFRKGTTDLAFVMLSRVQFATDLVTWLGQREKTMSERPSDVDPAAWGKEATARADQAVRDAQGGGQNVDLSWFERGNPVLRILTTFYTDGGLKLNATRLSASRTKWNDPLSLSRFMADMALIYWFVPAAAYIIGHAVGDEDEEPTVGMLIRSGLAEVADALPISREAVGPLKGYPYRGPAGLGSIDVAVRAAEQWGQGEIDAAMWRNSSLLVGTLLHLPAQAINENVEAIDQLLDGELPTAAFGIR